MSARPTPRWPVRSGLVGLGTALLWAAVLLVALRHPGRDHQSFSLQFRRPNATFGAAAPFSESGPPSANRTLRLSFDVMPGFPLSQVRSIGIPMDVSPDLPHHLGFRYRRFGTANAEIADPAGRILFRAPADFTLRDDTPLELLATPELKAAGPGLHPTNQPLRLELRLTTRAPENLSLWVRAVPSDPNGFETLGWLRIPAGVPPASPTHHLYFTGHYTVAVPDPPRTRGALLQFQWEAEGTSVLGFVLTLSTVLIGTGAALLAGALGPAIRRSWTQPLSAALLVTGLGFSYAVIHPPFSPPDEADHLLSYAEHVGDARLPDDLLTLARRDHIERLRARIYEHFGAADTTRPLTNYWEEHINTTPLHMRERSATTCRVWSATRPAIAGSSTGGTILRLRLVNATLLAISVGLAVFALGCFRKGDGEALHPVAWIPVLCAPGLLLFGTQVSNYFLLVSVQCLAVALVVAPWRSDRGERWRGLALGLVLGIGFVTSRAAVPLAGATAIALVARLFSPVSDTAPTHRRRASFEFWGLLALGVYAPSVFSLEAFDASARSMWRSLLPAGAPGIAKSIPYALGIAGVAIAAAFAEGMIRSLRRPAPSDPGVGPATGGGVVRWLAPMGVLALWLAPSFAPAGGLGYSTSYKSASRFIADAWQAFASSFGPGARDYMSSDTFWRACGYNEVVGPAFLTATTCTMVVFGWALWWWLASRRRSGRAQIVCLAVALAAYFTALAYGGFREMHGITGRYMVGVYAFVLLGAGAGWHALASALGPGRNRWLWILAALPLAIHTTHIAAVLGRFF